MIGSGKAPSNGQPALYVCRDQACQEPLLDAADVAAALDHAPQFVGRQVQHVRKSLVHEPIPMIGIEIGDVGAHRLHLLEELLIFLVDAARGGLIRIANIVIELFQHFN